MKVFKLCIKTAVGLGNIEAVARLNRLAKKLRISQNVGNRYFCEVIRLKIPF